MKDITALTVVCNTKELIENGVNSFRQFHPDMRLIIVDGSTPDDPCYSYVQTLADKNTTVGQFNYNIGHGRGMVAGISMIKTDFALIFDSDIVFLKSPVEQMLDMMDEDTYGVGYLEKTGFDGFEYGARSWHKKQGYMMMLHPFFHLLQVSEYYKFHPYTHHGAPCFKAARDIHFKGLTSKIIKQFPGLGHTHGKGWSWSAVPGEWILHDTAGTRNDRRKKGLPEIEGNWDR
jgi:glycosyltransferase involved in cell wall biosynthesis